MKKEIEVFDYKKYLPQGSLSFLVWGYVIDNGQKEEELRIRPYNKSAILANNGWIGNEDMVVTHWAYLPKI